MKKNLFKRVLNRVLHLMARFGPGGATLRPFLHRLRGVKIEGTVFIGEEVYLENEYPELIELHDGAQIALRSIVMCHFRDRGRVIIGKNVWVGPGCIIAPSPGKSLTIGEGSLVAAGSVVLRDIPPFTLNSDPVFLKIKKDNSEIFLLAVGEILDIQEKSVQPLITKKHFSRIAPVVMFLKHKFGDYCWHPKNKQACLVIDDPLLKSRYGFLEYTTLLKLMEKKGFATSIGFIPWNYKRTDPEIASLFRENRERLSISIHGCDHSNSEFVRCF